MASLFPVQNVVQADSKILFQINSISSVFLYSVFLRVIACFIPMPSSFLLLPQNFIQSFGPFL